jgi:cyclic beta-1,2-glucan synthetase
MPPRFVSTVDSGNLAACLWTVGQAFDEIASRPADETPRGLAARLRALASQARRFVDEMDFRSLYNPQRKLLSIGWDMDAGRLDPSCYDLLASEARTAHFIALAKGDVPLESWLYLGRTHILCHGHQTLLSWTGTMFEYLMPFLWTRCYPNTVLGRAATGAVRVQQTTAAAKRLPWGVSEAACSQKNAEGDYQYGPVGIPALALSPTAGVGERSFLVAPYATFLALPIDAAGALENLRDLKARGCLGRFGYYEAIEFSDNGAEIVRSWMAHHQGMSLVAACNALTGGVMRQYFHNNPSVAATELVLQEKMHLIVNAESA